MYYRDKCRSVSDNRFDQIDNGIDGILLRRIFHCLNVRLTVLIKVRDCFQEDIMIQFLFFQNNTVSLTFERTGVQDLVTTTCICRKWNQKIRFVQCKKLTRFYLVLDVGFFLDSAVQIFVDVVARRFPGLNQEDGYRQSEPRLLSADTTGHLSKDRLSHSLRGDA